MAMITACLAMLPRLEAEEAIAMFLQVAAGSATLDQKAREELGAAWNTAASAPGQRRSRVKTATPRDLKGIGVGYVRTPKKKAQADG